MFLHLRAINCVSHKQFSIKLFPNCLNNYSFGSVERTFSQNNGSVIKDRKVEFQSRYNLCRTANVELIVTFGSGLNNVKNIVTDNRNEQRRESISRGPQGRQEFFFIIVVADPFDSLRNRVPYKGHSYAGRS